MLSVPPTYHYVHALPLQTDENGQLILVISPLMRPGNPLLVFNDDITATCNGVSSSTVTISSWPVPPQIASSVTLVSDKTQALANGTDKVVFTATVEDSNGSPIPYQNINFNVPSGLNRYLSPITTNAYGVEENSMKRTSQLSRVAVVSLIILLMSLSVGSFAWSMNLPLSKELTVRLSTLNSQGQSQTVSEIVAKTNSLGKIAFNFPTVPSSSTTPFLHIQIMDGTAVLRQTIVPSPQSGGNVDVGVSEVTDLQARSLLKASAISGRLTPLHLLVAHALLRTPTISITNAESVGVAIAAGADAIAGVLATESLTPDQLSTFMTSLSKGLVDAAAMYRKSVDDAVVFDQKVEAYKRGEAYAVLLQSLITAGLSSQTLLVGNP